MNLKQYWQQFTAPTVRRIPPATLSRAKSVNILAGAMGASFGVLTGGAFLIGFVKELGAGDVHVGLLAGSMMLAQFLQLPSSLLIERLPRRKSYWFLTVFTHRLLWFVLALLPLFLASHVSRTAVWVVIGASMLSWLLAHASVPAWISWMGALIPEADRGAFFGRRQAIVQFASLVAMLVSGVFLDFFPEPSQGGDYLGYMLIFGMGALLGCADILLHMVIPEPHNEVASPGQSWTTRLAAPVRDPAFRQLMVMAAVFGFGAHMLAPFGVVYCLEDLGVSWSFLVSTLGTFNLAGAVLGSMFWGWLAARYGHKSVLVISLATFTSHVLLWFVVTTAPLRLGMPGLWQLEFPAYFLVLPVMNILGGFTFAGYMLSLFNLLLGLSPDNARPTYTALMACVSAVGGTLGPILGGLLAETFKRHDWSWSPLPGLEYGWWHLLVTIALVFWLASIVMAMRLPRPHEAAPGMVLSRLLSANPLRTFFYLYTINYSENPAKRARAARTLGESRSALAVRDLVEALNDHDWEVRSQSALSLGNINDPSALEALMRQLRDAASDVRLQAAESLGRLGGAEAATALLECLDDPSREVRLAVVRALGAMAYPAAEEPLMRHLVSEQDTLVRAAAATALGRLGNLKAVLEMIGALAKAGSPRTRDEIARAIGQSLTPTRDFDRLLMREQKTPGSGFARLCHDLEPLLSRLAVDKVILQRSLALVREGALDDDWRGAAVALHELTEAAARARHDVGGGDIDALALRLFMHDWLLGAALYYTLLLTQGEQEPGRDVVLLGLFMLRRALS